MPEESVKHRMREQARRWVPEEAREHLKAARGEFRQSFESIVPPEFIAHRRAARREVLLAARSLIDRALERLQDKNPA